MASARTMICTLKAMAESRSRNIIYNATRAQSSSTSSWIPFSSRKTFRDGRMTHHQQQQSRSVLSGETLPLQVNYLKSQRSGSASSFRSLEQRRQNHRFRNDKNENINRKIRKYESDLVVVLDMDECLIHSHFLQGTGAKFAHQVREKGSSTSPADDMTSKSVDTFKITLPDGERVLVHERPHLHEFLREVSSRYETHIFTAAMKVYAKPVLDNLDPHGEIFSGIWYRESCQLDTNMGAYIKNLGLLCESYDNDKERQQRLNRTVLVDNNPLSFLANPEHGILVSSFYDDWRDTTLPAVLDLLHELDKHEDVRPVLDAKFRLRQALDDITRGHPFSGRQQQIDEQQQQNGVAVAT